MPFRRQPLAAREIPLAPSRVGFATAHGDCTLAHPPQRPDDWKPEELPQSVHDWAAHVAAGRIGTSPPPADPAIAANRARTDAIFRRRAAERRRAEHDRLRDPRG